MLPHTVQLRAPLAIAQMPSQRSMQSRLGL